VSSGRVVLVGAGPGDPELITVKGLGWLRRAEVVVYDQLVSPSLLDEAPGGALRIFAGKSAGHHCLDQAAIDATNVGDAVALKQEAEFLGELKKLGMTVIGPEQGLDVEAFRTQVRRLVYPRFEAQWTKSLMEQVQAAGR